MNKSIKLLEGLITLRDHCDQAVTLVTNSLTDDQSISSEMIVHQLELVLDSSSGLTDIILGPSAEPEPEYPKFAGVLTVIPGGRISD